VTKLSTPFKSTPLTVMTAVLQSGSGAVLSDDAGAGSVTIPAASTLGTAQFPLRSDSTVGEKTFTPWYVAVLLPFVRFACVQLQTIAQSAIIAISGLLLTGFNFHILNRRGRQNVDDRDDDRCYRRPGGDL
jgi:hypothetical protein